MGVDAAASERIERMQARLASRLVELRTERGWSLEELESRTGVSRSTLSRIERAVTHPTTTCLAKVCAAYRRTVSGLLAEAEDAP
jgi:transcriptional regulator with XRE-family HTH domain